MSDVASNSDSVDFCQKIGLIDIRMCMGLLLIVEVDFFLFSFLIVQDSSDAFHIDDSINLSCGQLTESIFAAGTDSFLIHSAFPPKIPQPLGLRSLLEVAFFVRKSRSVYADGVGGDLFFFT